MDLLETEEAVLKDKEMLVFVDELADSSVVLGVRCFFLQDDYWTARWRLLENAKYALEEANIVIAYPQLDVHIQQ